MAIEKTLKSGKSDSTKEAPNAMIFEIMRTGAGYYFCETDSSMLVLLNPSEPNLAYPVEQATPGDLTYITAEQSLELHSILDGSGDSYEMNTPHNSETVRVVARFSI